MLVRESDSSTVKAAQDEFDMQQNTSKNVKHFCRSSESTTNVQLESYMKVKVELYFHTREKLELSCSDSVMCYPRTSIKRQRQAHNPHFVLEIIR